jgi:hypothetical protein
MHNGVHLAVGLQTEEDREASQIIEDMIAGTPERARDRLLLGSTVFDLPCLTCDDIIVLLDHKLGTVPARADLFQGHRGLDQSRDLDMSKARSGNELGKSFRPPH